jgi:hypothetical protein
MLTIKTVKDIPNTKPRISWMNILRRNVRNYFPFLKWLSGLFAELVCLPLEYRTFHIPKIPITCLILFKVLASTPSGFS